MKINNISAINLNTTFKANEAKTKCDCPACKDVQASALDCLASFNKPIITEYYPNSNIAGYKEFADGHFIGYWQDGKVSEELFTDKTNVLYNADGRLSHLYTSNGIERIWNTETGELTIMGDIGEFKEAKEQFGKLIESKDFPNGKKAYELYENYEVSFWPNGNREQEVFSDGTEITYHENGIIDTLCDTNGVFRRWDEKGELLDERKLS